MALPSRISNFLEMKSAPSILLLAFSLLAILINNFGNLAPFYSGFFLFNFFLVPLGDGVFQGLTVKDFINDGLMAIFFLLVGLQLKKEILSGELAGKSKLILPLAAALGGVILPALIYLNFNGQNAEHLKGWAIPSATDIAFAIGVLNFFGDKISNSLKVFLVALAVLDDLAAILIIAFFYSAHLNIIYLNLALLVLLILLIFNLLKITNLFFYLIAGVFLWIFVLKSGVHATIAGVLLALLIPGKVQSGNLKTGSRKSQKSPLNLLESKLQNPVNFMILPLFAFANCGINFADFSLNDFSGDKLILGIILGLFLGKQIGVFAVVYFLHKLKICSTFKESDWVQVYGVCILTGIGYTMSLFIGNLAFSQNQDLINKAVIGTLFGSLLSGVVGFLVILFTIKKGKKHGKLEH